ncbi:LacI family DNA-binding transcriptional regulator [Actinotalea sp. Marseille-Q4924]|uniref:LacI family DNA-binding transcriptional regulator n=1 Tax=Actinotalea sp. Marseille-Q4924 TaxID=2866571 RepID=UPI00351D94A3
MRKGGRGPVRSTIVDVARLAGVSTSTVSHVVNGTRSVTDGTRERVLAAIEQTGYSQHAAARALRRSRTDSIGLVVSDSGQPAFRDMVTGVEAAASDAGFVLLLADSAEDPDRELRAIEALQSRRVDGLILARAAGSSSAALDWPKSQDIPIVLIDRLTDPGLDQVGVESEAAMRALVGHLLDQGHRRVAITTGDLTVPTLQERYLGYLAAHSLRGVDVDPSLALRGDGGERDTRVLVAELLSRDDQPTALVSASSPMAVGALRAADDAGLRIPEDLAFVSFDSLPNPDLMRTAITTADQPAEDVGREAMRLLLRRLEDSEATPTTVRLAARISHRESCGCGNPTVPIGP